MCYQQYRRIVEHAMSISVIGTNSLECDILLTGVSIINSTDVGSTFAADAAAKTSQSLALTVAMCLVLFSIHHLLLY